MEKRSQKRKWRLWIPALVVLGAAGLIGWMYLTENWKREVASVGVGALAGLLVLFWWVFLSGLPWRGKLVRIVCLAVLGAGGYFLLPRIFRLEGSADGSALPKVVWRWSEKRGEAVGRLPEPVDLGVGVAVPGVEDGGVMLEGLVDFPQYLGGAGDGVVEDVGLRTDWSASEPELLWRREVGLGWSGFVVAGGMAVTQEQRGEDELVVAYDVLTGEVRWSHGNRARFSESMGGDGPRAVPSIDTGRGLVYVQGATGILDCLRLGDGELIWSRRVLEENGLGNISYGKSNSPLLVDDLVVVTGGREKRASLIAYKAESGEPVWNAGRDRASNSSPAVATLAGRRQIVIVNAASASGHDIATGGVLWSFAWPGTYPKVAQPGFPGGDRVLLSASYGAGTFLVEISSPGKGGAEGPQQVREVWKSTRMKTKFSSAVVRDGFAYGLDEGAFACIDLATGRRVWKEARYGYGQNLAVGGDGLFLIQSERGPVVIGRADPEGYSELARLPVFDEKTWNPPALAGRYLLVRNDREAACYRLPVKDPAS